MSPRSEIFIKCCFVPIHHFIGFLEHRIDVLCAVGTVTVTDGTFIFRFGNILFNTLNQLFYFILSGVQTDNQKLVTADPVNGLFRSDCTLETAGKNFNASSPAACPLVSLIAFNPFISMDTGAVMSLLFPFTAA